MRKTMLFLTSLMLISTISYGAFHKPGGSVTLNTTETPRDKTLPATSAATGNVNTLFYIMADAYTSYHYPNPAGYGDQVGESRIYWPLYQSQYLVKSVQAETGQQPDGSYDYDVHSYDSYTGWVSHYYYYAHVSTPSGYYASANAYIQWND